MDLIVEMRFGSQLYGTDTPQSDLDLKAVYVPNPDDILLQRAKATVTSRPLKTPGEKNVSGDLDRETYSLQKYLELLAEGQTVALDMLYAPDSAMTMPPKPLWREIQANANRLVSRRASSFVRYCRQQANKYGSKGSRIAAVRRALAMLTAAEDRLGTTTKLEQIATELADFAFGEHLALVDLPMPSGRLIRHLEVCGRRIAFTASIKTAREIAQRLVEEYGQRALQAERNEGIDWKALSHAVRVGHEAIELLQTGHITLPLPSAAHIRRIKSGDLPYEVVTTEIERLLDEVEKAATVSTLPDQPDQVLIEEIVLRAYRQKVVASV
jgi:predicted nucleotidyltransferase